MSFKNFAKVGVTNVLKAGVVGAATYGASYVLLPKVGVQTSDEKVQQGLLMVAGAAAATTLAVGVAVDMTQLAIENKKSCKKLEADLDGDSDSSGGKSDE